jgi:hypothetical protein
MKMAGFDQLLLMMAGFLCFTHDGARKTVIYAYSP